MLTHTLCIIAVSGALLVMAACDRSESPADPVAGATATSCPVTIPPQPGFQPSASWSGTILPEGSVWYGTDELWTFLATDGDHGRRKSVWWSASFGGGTFEPQPEIGVVWHRIDGDSPLVIHADAHGTNAFTDDQGWAMMNGIDPEEPGCWEVTATYSGATLSYIYEHR